MLAEGNHASARPTTYDAIVIGTSQGGRLLPITLAQAGRSVALVERDHLGGTCVNVGCAILGLEGGEIMAVILVAMMGKLPYTALQEGRFTHPTLAEGLSNLFMTLDA